MTLIPFLTLTFAISLAGFGCILFFPAARNPESLIGFPFWLIMVWGPSLAAIILSLRNGTLTELLIRSVKISTVPLSVWVLVLSPLILLVFLRPVGTGETTQISLEIVLSLVLFNLILGPLGEELGWRGVMQEHLNQRMGWLSASLIIGAVWVIWHLPLWTIDSPHAQISLRLFATHCMLYSIIIGGAYTLSGGSILPAILIHLTLNVASNLAIFTGFREPNDWFSASLLPFVLLTICTIILVRAKSGPSANFQLF